MDLNAAPCSHIKEPCLLAGSRRKIVRAHLGCAEEHRSLRSCLDFQPHIWCSIHTFSKMNVPMWMPWKAKNDFGVWKWIHAHGNRPWCCRYFYERALLGLQQVFRSSPGKAGADPSASPQIDASPPKPAPKGQPPAQAAETLDPGTIPKNPTGEGADKLHQYKKEASSQQAP